MIDIGYGIRLGLLLWKYRGKQPSKDLFIQTITPGRCSLNDLDTNFHMNNSRFLRESDFGRIELLIQTGLWNIIMKQRNKGFKDASIFVSALQVQFRQSIQWGDQFNIHSTINGWDDKAFYIEQSITQNKNQQIAFSLIGRLVPTPRSLTPQSLVDQLNIGLIQSPSLSNNIQTFKDNHRLDFNHIKSKS